VAYHVIFTVNSGMAANFNTLLGYVALLAFVPVTIAHLSFAQQARILFLISLGYLIIYVGANNVLVEAARRGAGTVSGILDSGDDRGARVYLAALSTSFVAFYAFEDRSLRWFVRLAAIALAVTAIILSNSRTFAAIFAFIFVLRMVRLNNRPVMFALALIFLGVSAAHLYGLLDRSWNPYEWFFHDLSGLGRYREYPQAIRAAQDHWFLGVGIEPDPAAMASYLQVPKRWGGVFFGDLGALGPLGQFGLFGLTLFLVASVLCIMSAAKKSSEPGIAALRLNCALNGLCGIIAPNVLWPPGCFFTTLLFGFWLRQRHARSSRARLVAPGPALYQAVPEAKPGTPVMR
jgi:hypothetical protein